MNYYRRGWAALEIEKWHLGHGSGPKLGNSYRLASGTWGKAKAGAQLVSIRLASEIWSAGYSTVPVKFSIYIIMS